MASPAQCEANRANAQGSTGPSTVEGKSASSRNATKFGLFATNNCILPGEEREYEVLCKHPWLELDPVGALEEATAAEYVRAVWRLRRCAMAEERLGWRSEWFQQDSNRERHEDLPPSDPAIHPQTMAAQTSVDRARAQAQNCMRRAKAELDKLQATRSTRTIAQNEPDSDACLSQDESVLQTNPIRSPFPNRAPRPGRSPLQGRTHLAKFLARADQASPPPCAVSCTVTPTLELRRPRSSRRRQRSESRPDRGGGSIDAQRQRVVRIARA